MTALRSLAAILTLTCLAVLAGCSTTHTRGGGYGEGTPRHGWDHSLAWLTHGVALAGLEPRFITAELTLAPVNPGMKHLIPLAEKSLTAAEREIDDDLWSVIRA